MVEHNDGEQDAAGAGEGRMVGERLPELVVYEDVRHELEAEVWLGIELRDDQRHQRGPCDQRCACQPRRRAAYAPLESGACAKPDTMTLGSERA